MAYKTITFDSADITDADASDGVVVVGGLKFTVTAPGSWTLNFANNCLNFSEDPAYAGSAFKIEITDVDGAQFKYADYVIGYTANPAVVNGFTPGLNINGMTMGDTSFSGNYQHPDHSKYAWRYSSGGMGGEVTTSRVTIIDEPIIGDTQNPYSTLWLDNLVVDTDYVPPNIAPTFVGATTSLSVSQNSTTVDVSALLHVRDSDSAQTLTWSMASAPGHGTLSLSGATAASGSTNISPGGSITYTPAVGFAGVDTFTVQVSDGTATTTRTITVNVNPSSPGSPDLTAASDTGLSSTDNVTAASILAFSGTGPVGDTTSTVRVFIDGNGNGVYDAGADASATAVVNNGAWSVSNLSTTSLSSGTYNVYALITSASGGLVSAASGPLAITLDKTAPSITFSGLALSSDTGASSSDFITNVAPQTIIATLTASLESGDRVMGSLDNGATWSDITSKVSGTSLTWSGVTLAGSGTIRLQILDQHGNGSAIASQAYTLDTTAPTTAVGSAAFSADTGLSATDFVTRAAAQTISGTLSANLAADETVQVSLNNGYTWTAAVASVGSSAWSLAGVVLSGSNTLLVKVTDTAGNDGAIYSQAYVLDTTAPLLTITSDRSVLKAGEPATITFTFSEDPGANFTWDGSAGDIVVSGGTLSALSGSGTTRTAVFMPAAGVDFGTASITVAAGSYTDAAGNGGGAGVTPSLTFDNAAPAVAITSGNWTDDPSPVIAGTAETGATIHLTIGGAIYITTAAQGTWSIDLGVATPALGSLSLDINGDNLVSVTATDTVGNVSAAVTQTLEIDINDLPTGTVAIRGVAVKGEMLTASHTLTDADGLGLISYQWQADGADIAGATGATFILAEAQVGKAITVRASYTDGSGHAESVTSSATTPVMLVPDLVVTPNANGGADIVITDPSQLTGDLGTSGIDQVVYSGSGTVILPDNIENLTLTGGNANGVGNDLRNVVRGSAGDNALQGMAGNDWINSGDGRDSIDGGVGADFIFGGSGTDLIDGGSGNDKLQGASGNDQIAGGAGKDSVYGGNGDDRLSGGVGHDRVNGGLGHDWISGGSGNDTLYGGSGQDRFVFDTKPNTISNVDKILDFKPSDDSIYLDEAIFTELGEGSDKGAAIGQEMFVSASRAQDAQDRIIYDQETGSLYYDRDGTGSAAQVKFATLSNKAKLSFHDFFVI